MAVWNICESFFKCDVADSSSFIRLEMAQEWMKTLPYSILQFNCIQKVLKRSTVESRLHNNAFKGTPPLKDKISKVPKLFRFL